MQSVKTLILFAVAGACLLAALQHLLIAWRGWRKDVHSSFALVALCVAGFVFANGWVGSSGTRVLGAKVGATWASLWNITLLWFVAFYTGIRPRKLVWALTIPFVVFVVVNCWLPLDLLHAEASPLSTFTPPWAARRIRLSEWGLLLYLLSVVLALYLLYACRWQFRHGKRQPAIALGIGVMAMLIALINDLLVTLRISQFVYLSEFGFLPLIAIMSFQLSRDLEESREHFRLLTSATFEGIGVTERGRIIDVNEQIALMLGQTRAELLGRDVLEFVAPESRDEVMKAIQSGQQGPYEHLARRGDGSVFPVEVRARWMNLEGRTVRVTVLRDITQRKLAERALAEAQERELRAHDEFTRQLISTQEQERKRLANELHDSLGQNLSIIKNRSILAASEAGVTPNVAAHFAAITGVVSGAIDEVRSLAQNLRPLHIEQVGLTASLKGLVDQVAEATSLQVHRRLENVDDLLKDEKATQVYRIVQEALNNVVKHARATQVKVILERDLRSVRINIEDNGRGFVPSEGDGSMRKGIGLISLSERARILGGSLEIRSEPNQGTRLRIELPVTETPSEPEATGSSQEGSEQ